MNTLEPARPPTKRRLRWPVRLAVAAGVLALAALVGWSARNRWLTPWLARELCAELEATSGASVTIEGLTWVEFGEVEVRGLRMRPHDSREAPIELDLRRARALFSVVALLRDEPDWLTGVEIEGLRLVLRPDPSATPAPPKAAEDGGAWMLPGRLANLSVRDVELDLDFGDLKIAAQGNGPVLSRMESGAEDARTRVRLHFDRFRLQRGPEVALEGALEAELCWQAPRLELERLRLDGEERGRASWVDLPRGPTDALAWHAELGLCSGWIDSTGAVEDGALDSTFALDGVELQPLLRLILIDDAPPLAGTVHAGVRLRAAASGADRLRITFDGRAPGFSFYEHKLDELVLDAEFALDAEGTGSTLRARRVSARRGTDHVEARDLVLPFRDTLHDVLSATRGSIELTVSDLPGWLRVEPPEFLLPTPEHALELSLRLSDDGVVLDRGRIRTVGGSMEVRPSSIAWGLPDDPLRGARVDVGLDVDFSDLSELGTLVTPERPWRGSLRGGLVLAGTVGALAGRFDLEGHAVEAAGWALGELSTRATLDARQLAVERFEASGPLGVISLVGLLDMNGERLEGVRLSLCTDTLQTLLPGLIAGGRVELEAQLDGRWRDPRGLFTARARDLVPIAGPVRRVEDVELAGVLDQGHLALTRLAVRAGEFGLDARAELSHAAWNFPWQLELREFALRKAALELALEGPARIAMSSEELLVQGLRLSGSAGHVVLDLDHRSAETWAHLEVLELDAQPLFEPLLARFLPAGPRMRGVRGHVELARGIDRFEVGGELAIDALRLAPDQPEIAVRTRASLAQGRLAIEEFSADAGNGGKLELAGELPLDVLGAELLAPGALVLRGRLALGSSASWPWPGTRPFFELADGTTLQVDLGGTWSAVTGEIGLDAPGITLVTGAATSRRTWGPAAARARVKLGSELEVSDLVVRAFGELDLSGRIHLATALDLRRLHAEGAGFLLDAPLTMEAGFDVEDLSFAARILQLRRAGGRLNGNLRIGGTARAPEPLGHVELTNGELRLFGDVPALQAVQGRLRFDERVAEFENLRCELGGGQLSASGKLDWSGARPDLQLAFRGEEVLVVQRSDLRVRADADITITGPLDAALVQGRLSVRDGRYTKDVEFLGGARGTPSFDHEVELFSIKQEPFANLRFDVAVASAQPLEIANNIARGAVRVDMHLRGTGRAPELTGALFIDPTRVRLPFAVLQSTGGTVRLDRDAQLVPQLDLHFDTRVMGYDITIRIEGTATAPEVELSSVPPLANEDLLLLVLTGKPPTTSWGDEANNEAVRNMALYVGTDVFRSWFGTPEDGESWFERVEWRMGADVTRSGGQTSEVTLRLLGEGRGPGRSLLLHGERDAYDRSNLGVRLLFRMR